MSVIITIILVPIFFGLYVAIKDTIGSIGADRRRRRAQERAIDRYLKRR